jgi:polysaccharide pyruvyl transferase WcaK-like protein
MATGWSETGLKWCRAAFSRPGMRAVFLRDADSKDRWDDLMGPQTGHVAQVVRDPGLLASSLYPAPARPEGRRPVAGLGLMSHIAIRYHADSAPNLERLGTWYEAVARGLIAEGFQVRIFTNGSPEDKAYAATLAERLRALGLEEDILFLEQRTPEGLCRHIADFDVLIAYRMHAVIAAYSYGVPAIALSWDRKLAAFMASVNRQDHLLDVAKTAPEVCVEMAEAALRDGLPEEERQNVLREAHADVAKLWAVFAEESK